jgi:drug/metabolite transporter (DMT)-like permease
LESGVKTNLDKAADAFRGGMDKTTEKGLIYSLLFSLFWSLEILIDKIALKTGGVKNASSYALQVTLASAIFLTAYILLRERHLLKIETISKHLGSFLLLGVLISAATLLGMWGLKLSTSINYGFLVKSTIIFVPIFAVLFLKDRLSKVDIGLILAFLAGLYLLSVGGQGFIPRFGDILIIATAICYAAATVYQKSLGKINARLVSWGRMSFPFPFVLAYVLITAGASVLHLEPILYVVLSAISSVLCVLFLSLAIQDAPATYVSMISMSVPVLNTAFGYLFVGETLTPIKALGAAIILGAGTFLMVQQKRESGKREAA